MTCSRNETSTVAPGASGEARLMTVEGIANEALNPPPRGWLGGSSSVVPLIKTVPPPQGCDSRLSDEVTARRSAAEGELCGKVVMSMMRKRTRVTIAPVLFVMRRRISIKPVGEPVLVRLGAVEVPTHGATSDEVIAALSLNSGEVEFSGPGAPSENTPPAATVVACVSAQ